LPSAKRKREGFFTIGVVSRMFDIHPQTLRLYEKRGLLAPARTEGNTRLYSQGDIETLEFILTLTNDLHVNVAGVEIIVHLRERLQELQQRLVTLGETAEASGGSKLGASCTALVRLAPPRLPVRAVIKDVTPRPRPSRNRRAR
jgi:MerR family transcriptional regulator/heat shock protein HspR